MEIVLPSENFRSTQAVSMLNPQKIILFIPFYPFRIRTVTASFFVTMYSYHPCLLAKSNIPKQNFSHGVNDICDGSPSRIRSVLRISLGMTTRPSSSILRTIPVAFKTVPSCAAFATILKYLVVGLLFVSRAVVCGLLTGKKRRRAALLISGLNALRFFISQRAPPAELLRFMRILQLLIVPVAQEAGQVEVALFLWVILALGKILLREMRRYLFSVRQRRGILRRFASFLFPEIAFGCI